MHSRFLFILLWLWSVIVTALIRTSRLLSLSYRKTKVSNTLKYMFTCFRANLCWFKTVILNDILDFLQMFIYKYFWIYFFVTIWFIPNQKDFDVFIAIIISLWNPELLDIFQGWGLSEIVNHDNTICTFVICWCNSSEPLLTCSIPYLKFYRFSFVFYSFESKS
jgi:hypothetical protein